MQLEKLSENFFVFRCYYENREIPKKAGFWWDPEKKYWYTKYIDIAMKLKDYAVSDVKKEFEKILVEKCETLKASNGMISTIEVPAPESLSYLGFQKAGVEFISKRKNVLLADEMGCIDGKATIIVNRGGCGRRYKLKDAYMRFNKLTKNKRLHWEIPSYTQSLINGELRLNRIKKILYTGKKYVIGLETEFGKVLRLTRDHEICDSSGDWKRVDTFKVGDLILCNSIPKKEVIVKIINKNEFVDVYDIVMEEPGRNFVANGIIVHNCGKTIQAIGYLNYDKNIKKVLVVCPASLKLNWGSEIKKWLVRTDVSIFITNYERVWKEMANLKSIGLDLIILDESHYIKNMKSKRFKTISTLSKGIKKKLFMTGTPILNRPIEIFSTLRLFNHSLGKNWLYFVKKYCNAYQGGWGWVTDGASNTEELHRELCSTIMIRRRKNDVLSELPKKRRQLIEIENKDYAEIRNEAWVLSSAREKYAHFKKHEGSYRSQVGNLKNPIMSMISEIQIARHNTALKKVELVYEELENLIESEEKVVVFAHHLDVIEKIYQRFGKVAVKFTGEMELEDRQKSVDRFQSENNVKLFIGSIRAASFGITLTAASTVVFLELDWTPAIMTQAEDRLHRVGQKESVLVLHYIIQDSIDCMIAKRLIEKQDVISSVVDGVMDEDISLISGLLE